MRRLMLALGLVVWLLLATVAWRSENLVAREQSEPTPVLSGNSLQIDGELIDLAVITVRLDPQTGELSFVLAESSSATPASTVPVPTTPPIATDTPLPPPPTLTPSATPPDTNTPRPSATPETVLPTPTPESTGLPTLPPDDQEKLCLVKVRGTAINERTGPGVSFPKTATSPIPAGSTVKVLEVRPGSGDNYLWGRNAFGWFVLREGSTWWVDGLEGATELCVDVLGWPAGLEPPAPIARAPGVGWTTTYGYDPALWDVGERLRAKGYAPSVTLTDNTGEACAFAARGWRVLARPWYALGLGDDPDLTIPPEASAAARVEALAGYVTLLCADSDSVTVALTNETRWPSADYVNRWIVAACQACETRGWRCAPVTFSVGTPEIDWTPALRPALAALAGGDHALGYNAYGYARDALLCDQSAQWTVWRVRLLRLAAGDAPWPRVIVTEAARGAGDMPPLVSDAACFVRWSSGAHDDVNLWCAGNCGVWSGARWTGDMMRALAEAL